MEYQQLQDEIKAAMKARDNHRRDILRQVHTELKAIGRSLSLLQAALHDAAGGQVGH